MLFRSPSLIGHYAGAVTRLVAFVLDLTLSVVIFNLAFAGADWMLGRFTGLDLNRSDTTPFALLALAVWQFTYFAYCWTLSGKTPAMALLGLRVVRGDGRDLGRRSVLWPDGQPA